LQWHGRKDTHRNQPENFSFEFHMKLTFQPFELLLKHAFTIAKFSRTSTPVMLVQVAHEGETGYGEASMVPYMGESFQSATEFLNKVDLNTPLISGPSSLTWTILRPASRPLKRASILPCTTWTASCKKGPAGKSSAATLQKCRSPALPSALIRRTSSSKK